MPAILTLCYSKCVQPPIVQAIKHAMLPQPPFFCTRLSGTDLKRQEALPKIRGAWKLLLNTLMWSGLIEIDHTGFEEAVELLLTQDQKVIQAFSPHAQLFWRSPMRSRLPQLLGNPEIERILHHIHVNDLARFEYVDEENKKWTEKESVTRKQSQAPTPDTSATCLRRNVF